MDVDSPTGSVIGGFRVGDLVAQEPQTGVLAVGGPRGAVYEPPAWEAERHRAAGDFDDTRQSLPRRSSAAPTSGHALRRRVRRGPCEPAGRRDRPPVACARAPA